jgi:Pvc16 N-terminal domain
MSNFRSIATVTATMQRVLQSAVQADVPGATVSTVRPAEGSNTNLPTTGVNIFLYQVSHNAHRGNADLPTRRGDGELVQRPQAALDLHYLLSFYGDDLALEPQRLLGSAVAFFHSQPQLTRAQIRTAVADSTKPFLANSDLADQVDLVRFTPLSMSLEELSRLWSVFLQVHYTLSVTYKASLVLVEPQLTPRQPLPTRAFNLAAIPLRQPYVSKVVAQAGEGTPITPGSAVYVEGLDLDEKVIRVEIDGDAVGAGEASNTRIGLTLPAVLAAGPHSIQVRHGVEIGPAGPTRMAFSSNLGAFVVRPVITKTGGAYDITVSNVQGSGSAARSATIDVRVAPDVRKTQVATAELLTAQQVAYTFRAARRTSDTAVLSFAVSGVTAGDYLIRVRIDGAESPLDLDANRAPIAPKVTIP